MPRSIRAATGSLQAGQGPGYALETWVRSTLPEIAYLPAANVTLPTAAIGGMRLAHSLDRG
jgi:hypothetical protein